MKVSQNNVVFRWLFYQLSIFGSVEPQTGNIFAKVSNILPDDLNGGCLLKSVTPRFTSSLVCTSLCAQTPNCYLTCFDSNVCQLYYSFVSRYWNSSSVDASVTVVKLSNFNCYSSWIFNNDVTDQIVNSTAATYLEPFYPRNAYIGYYCIASTLSYVGIYTNPNWYQADFGSPRTITQVIVVTRYVDGFPNYGFDHVEVRVGNIPGNGNFEGNAFFASFLGFAAMKKIVTFSGIPQTGRYLSLNSPSGNYLDISDLKVIGY